MDNNQQQINSKTITSNLMWRFLERFGVYIVSFIISVVLARILDPSTYGVVALMTVVITFLDVFVTGGFSNSLIHDKDTTEKDFNTLLIFNISFSIVLYVLLFIISPLIASYYEKEVLTWLIRVSGISLLISGVKSLQYAYVAKRLEFKKFFYATIGGTIFSGIIGIVMAVNGLGAWALVVQGVVNHFIDSTILWFVIDWRPRVEFDKKLLKKHFSFGIKILIYKIIYNISNNARQLVIGKKYSESDLSFYNKGKTYPNMIGQNIYNSVNSVMFPVLAKTQDDKDRFNEILAKSFKINVFVMLPICIGLFSVSESFIHLLIGEKWLPCVPYIKVFCIVVFLNSIEAIFSNGPMALGKSTASMILGIMECVFNIIALIVAIPHGVMAIGYSMIVSSIFNCVIYSVYLYKLSNLNIIKLLMRSLDTFASSIIMSVAVLLLAKIEAQYYAVLIIQVGAGAALYYLINRLIKNDALDYCLSIVNDMIKKH